MARHNVAERVVAHVAHMDAARRIRKHLEYVVFGLGEIVARLEGLRLLPALLPQRFGFAEIVAGHVGFGLVSEKGATRGRAKIENQTRCASPASMAARQLRAKRVASSKGLAARLARIRPRVRRQWPISSASCTASAT
jgi:hypothetical protein